jgi:hypothetical protein
MSGYEQKYIQEVFNTDGVDNKDHNLAGFEES